MVGTFIQHIKFMLKKIKLCKKNIFTTIIDVNKLYFKQKISRIWNIYTINLI